MDTHSYQGTDILPWSMRERFNAYPYKGQSLEPQLKTNGRSRDGYALTLYQKTGQIRKFATCAYCGLSFIDDPAHWYLLSVDHIVPRYAQERLGLEERYINAMANLVLCCKACNECDNQDDLSKMPDYTPPSLWTAEDFFILRDRAFLYRHKIISASKEQELEECYVLKWGGKRSFPNG